MKQLLAHQVVCGIRIPVYRAAVEEAPCLRDDDGALLDGRFVGEENAIYVRKGISRTLERDALNHELLHALAAYSGLRAYLAGISKSPSQAAEQEEIWIRIVTPHIASIRWAR